MKELLLYSTIWNWTAESLLTALEEYKDSGITIRVNCRGGEPKPTFGIIAKLKEIKESGKNVLLKVDGSADSMALYLLCYTEAECLDVSTFVLHRAAFDFEDDLVKKEIDERQRINDFLRAAFESKVDVAKFEKLKGVTLDEVFDTEGGKRIDVLLTAKEALAIGLVSKINPINKKEMKAVNERLFGVLTASTEPKKPITNPKNTGKMTLAELKEKHPELFAQIQTDAVTAERDRVGSLMVFVDVDKEAITKLIKEGGIMSATMLSEMTMKMIAAKTLAAVEGENADGIKTPKAPKNEKELSAEAKELADFEAKVNKEMGIETK